MRTRLALLAVTVTVTVTVTASACVELDDEQLSETTQDVRLPGYAMETGALTTNARAATVVGRCPSGTVVLGGTFAAVDHTGAYINTVVPLLSVPTAGNGGWMVQARNSQRGTWTLRTTAICGAAPAGYQVVVSQTARDATITKQQTVSCPAGKRTTGGGYVLHDGNGQPIDGEATYVMPSWDATSWLVNARAVARDSKWVLTLYAVCADATLPGFDERDGARHPRSQAAHRAVLYRKGDDRRWMGRRRWHQGDPRGARDRTRDPAHRCELAHQRREPQRVLAKLATAATRDLRRLNACASSPRPLYAAFIKTSQSQSPSRAARV